MAIENRAKGRGEWNTYTVVAIDGVIKLAVNGKFVNGIARATQKKGYPGSAIRRRRDSLPQHQDHGAAARRDVAGTDRAAICPENAPALTSGAKRATASGSRAHGRGSMRTGACGGVRGAKLLATRTRT